MVPDFLYIGGYGSMEEQMMRDEGVRFKAVFCGKMRRYFSWRNFVDIFLVPVGILQAWRAIRRFKADVVFCKGGYASFPAAIGGFLAGVPVVLHESDVGPGLANKVAARFAKKICVSFEESKKFFPERKVVYTGPIVRREILMGDAERGRGFAGLAGKKPMVLFMGGSQGALSINRFVWQHLHRLLQDYEVVHVCGKNNIRTIEGMEGYAAFEFVGEELKDLYALAVVVVTRSGAATLGELGALEKPCILIPLGRNVSRGDQIENAKAFAKYHEAVVIEDSELAEGSLQEELFFKELARLVKEGKKRSVALGRNGSGDVGMIFDAGTRSTGLGSSTRNVISLLESLC